MRHSFIVIVFFERHAPSEQRTVHKTEANIGILVYHLFGRARISLIRTFIFGYSNSDVARESMPSLPYNMNPSVNEGPLKRFSGSSS